MTEPVLATAIPATPLAEYLATAGTAFAESSTLLPYLGTLTPGLLDAPEAETRALLTGAAVHDLGWLRRIAIRGEDRFRWLSGMVTNAVETLPDNTGAYNLVLNAQGRIQGDLYVWRDGDAVELEVTAEQSEALLAHLDKFIIMDDVELVPLEDESALQLTGPLAEKVFAQLGITRLGIAALPASLSSSTGEIAGIPVRIFRGYGTAVPHYAIWVATAQLPAVWNAIVAAGASPVGAASLEKLRIIEGIPAYGIDIQSRDLAQETSQERALNFTKGCYLGQEIVERIRSRGQVHRHLRSLELTPEIPGNLPAPGTELRIAGNAADIKPIGTITSVASVQLEAGLRVFAIGMIRAEAEVGRKPLVYPGGSARILNTTPQWNAV
ncbi:CAF17-like 4Fe-4S cluster assembly/insertion protein YgfZ [Acidicapsa ligni]|uniref:CAF17-like 4Fe-4S cluster assembly/insertion protein YgfZ n=1 Tax=Acidicapsa ligni TaxID=542300 RepID=UPI0021DFA36E|nr:folate-binding protein [Acidicapsa ligni]